MCGVAWPQVKHMADILSSLLVPAEGGEAEAGGSAKEPIELE